MTWHDLKLRVRSLVRRRQTNRDLDDELAFHIEREIARQIADGASPRDARRLALARFGSVAVTAEECRDQRGTATLDALGRDLRYAVTQIRRTPLAAATIVVTIAIGLSLLAVVFAVYNSLYLADPVRMPDELAAVYRPPAPGNTGAWVPFTRAQYDALRTDNTVFTDVLAMMRGTPVRIDGRRVIGSFVSGNFFQVLGIAPALGRTLVPADDVPGAGNAVIVLSHAGWSRLAARDPQVIGRRVMVGGVSFEVVGVTPEAFRGLDMSIDWWAPLARSTGAGANRRSATEPTVDYVIGRLKPGTSVPTAAAALTAWVEGRDDIAAIRGLPKTIRLEAVAGTLVADAFAGLRVFGPLFILFGLVLLIGCANVASLLLARGVSRQREVGIRLSLGASRQRVVRQFLTESLLLGLLGAGLGLMLSTLMIAVAGSALVSAIPGQLVEQLNLTVPSLDWRVYAFTCAVALVATALFGLGPALAATRVNVLGTIRGELARGVRVGHARQVLVAVQVCGAVLLLVAALVFMRSAAVAADEDKGVRTSDTLAVHVAREDLRPGIVAALANEPSAIGLVASSPAPLDAGGVNQTRIEAVSSVQGGAGLPVESGPLIGYRLVSPGYFDLLDIQMVAGRQFRQDERSLGAGVAILSERLARTLWPDGSALGRVIRVGGASIDYGRGPNELLPMPSSEHTVVGIARDVPTPLRFLPGSRIGILAIQGAETGVYLPTNLDRPDTTLTVRARDEPERARRRLLQAIGTVEPNAGEVYTLHAIAATSTYALTVAFVAMALLGGAALLLTSSGLFGTLSHLVEQRRHEIGVRMALGASAARVTRLVLGQSALPVAIGLAGGIGLAVQAARMLSWIPLTLLSSHGNVSGLPVTNVVRAFDPVAYVAGIVVILTACAAAAVVPVRRAARVDPITSLRQD